MAFNTPTDTSVCETFDLDTVFEEAPIRVITLQAQEYVDLTGMESIKEFDFCKRLLQTKDLETIEGDDVKTFSVRRVLDVASDAVCYR